jgi:hypothetical protein
MSDTSEPAAAAAIAPIPALRLSTPRHFLGALPADIGMPPDHGLPPRIQPAALFAPARLGKTDDYEAAPRSGGLGALQQVRSARASVQRQIRSAAALPAVPATGDTPVAGDVAPVSDAPVAEARAGAARDTGRDAFGTRAAGLLPDDNLSAQDRFGANATDATYDFDEYVILNVEDAPPPFDDSFPIDGIDPIGLGAALRPLVAEVRNGVASILVSPNPTLIPIGGGRPTGGIFPDPQFANVFPQAQEIIVSQWTRFCALDALNKLGRLDRADVAAKTGGRTPEAYYGASLRLWLRSRNVQAEVTRFILSLGRYGLAAALGAPLWAGCRREMFQLYFDGQFASLGPGQASPAGYGFEPYPTNEILFGLRVVHRQTWHLLGYARGELVKTIPLGPRESQKISTRILRRRKVSKTSEDASSYETSQEIGQTTKDTSEVVAEAGKKLGAHAEAEVSGGIPVISGKLSAGVSAELSQSSKQTNGSVNEAMQKTASKMRHDTKVTISTEMEDTFEVTRSSELVNPNDEVAVTYLYHRLQQRHWVSTEVGEVQSTVFVPEELPVAIDEAWVRNHGDDIAGALLDPVYAPMLDAIRREPAKLTRPNVTKFAAAADAGTNKLTDYANFHGGGDMPDILASGQAYYERQLEREHSQILDEERRAHQQDALFAHIRRHILHYMRAIWASEDRDRRMQRYARIWVPTRVTFVPSPIPPAPPQTSPPEDVPGVFVPEIGSARPLSEIIDPAGPIDYVFNCAVYRLRDDPRLANLHIAMASLRAMYVRHQVTATPSRPGLTIRDSVAHTPRGFFTAFSLLYDGTNWAIRLGPAGQVQTPWLADSLPDGAIDTLGVRIWLEGAPQTNDRIDVVVRSTGTLEDPHLKLVRMMNPLPPAAAEGAFFTPELQRMILGAVPELAGDSGPVGPWAGLAEPRRELFRRYYQRALMLREAGRVVAIDTANLVLDLETSTTPALERFKLLHRYVDALSAHEDLIRRAIDNDRRDALVQAGEYADPDIERVTVVGPESALRRLAVLPGDGGDGSDGEEGGAA